MKAFTLIEVLIGIGIVVILAAIGASVFKNLQPTLQLSGITRELITDFRYAQQLTITKQIEHGVRFFSTEKKYQIIEYGAAEEVLKERVLPPEIGFSEINNFTGDEVKFNPYGAVKESGTIILINTVSNVTTTIEIRPSGFVK